MIRAHLSTCAAIVLLALLVGCSGDDETTRAKPSRPAAERPAAPTGTDREPGAPAVPDGGLEQGHGVDDP
jgi:hypothetical protein